MTLASTDWLRDYPYVRTAFERRGGVDAQLAAAELDKFFCLTKTFDGPLAMISENIDQLWHELVQFTEMYGSFCANRYGHFIHHRARTADWEIDPTAVTNFYAEYELAFGPLPEVWELDAPAEVVDFGRGRTRNLPAVAWSGWPGRGAVAGG